MYDSSNSKKSSSSNSENMLSSSTHFNQEQEEQSSVQKEELNSASLGKLDDPVSQIEWSNFDRIENVLSEEDGCSISSSDVDDDDDTDGEYGEQELWVKFKKLINKHIKLQKRYVNLLCSHKELIDSYALLELAHGVMLTKVKDFKVHICTCAPPYIDLSCANSYCSQVKPSCNEDIFVEICDSFIVSENDEFESENEMLKIELSRLKGKSHVQSYQDNRDHIVKKIEKR
jgi:hypothetical protein